MRRKAPANLVRLTVPRRKRQPTPRVVMRNISPLVTRANLQRIRKSTDDDIHWVSPASLDDTHYLSY